MRRKKKVSKEMTGHVRVHTLFWLRLKYCEAHPQKLIACMIWLPDVLSMSLYTYTLLSEITITVASKLE